MLRDYQIQWLSTIPDDKSIVVKPLDPGIQEAAHEIINSLKKILPDLDIHFGGSSALGLPGQNDIDLDILSSPADYEKYTPLIEKLFGAPEKHASYIEWKFDKNGFEVELCLTDRNSLSMKEQIKIYQILSNNKDLAEEYRNIKLPYGRINFKEYTKKKYAFFNKVLEN